MIAATHPFTNNDLNLYAETASPSDGGMTSFGAMWSALPSAIICSATCTLLSVSGNSSLNASRSEIGACRMKPSTGLLPCLA